MFPFASFAGALPSVQRKPSETVFPAAGFAIGTPASQTRDLPFLTQVNVFPEYVTFCFAVEHFVPAFGFAACANPIPTSESEAVRTRAIIFLIPINYHQG
jgi:hypothetical protein